MASSTGVLPFLRGANFSHNNFQGENFPHTIIQMKGLKWLKLTNTKLDWIPEEFSAFENLDTLNISHNNLTSLHGEIICLKNLKFLMCRHNRIIGENIPVELFDLRKLTVLDMSHNNLSVIPKCLEQCKSLTVLNLSHNNLKHINEQLFTKLTELLQLDLSHNELKLIPPQLGRLSKLRTLILSNNPLEEAKLRQLERLKTTLTSLHLENTQRNMNNTPPNLFAELTNLVELNISSNELTKVPDEFRNLILLKRLNLSENSLKVLPEDFGNWWPSLERLNLSRNMLTEIPQTLCKLCNLKRLYLNDNQLTFDGLPAALGKLHQLEIFMAARNNLELIPESIFRCGRLKKLILTSNKLITLPDTIHLLYDLEVLDLSNNPDLIMPPKPISDATKNSEFYNIDFSLNTQLRLAGDPNSENLPRQQSNAICDPVARKLRLRRRAKDEDEIKSRAEVLKEQFAKDNNKDKDNRVLNQPDFLDLRPKRWDEILEKPSIDYSDFFDDTTGQIQGLTIWYIDKFCPELLEPNLHGKFYYSDCYIVLSTEYDENFSLNWKIFYWIGAEASLDKKACSAIHAVGLRNHLNAHCRTIREEQGEESDEFLALFADGIDYVRGEKTPSGFYTVEETEYTHRMFRLHEVAEKTRQLHLETVAVSSHSLDSRLVFLVDLGTKIFIWNGMKSKNTTRQKARLLGEKLNKEERKNKAELIFCEQGDEPPELLEELELTDPLPRVPFATIDLPNDFEVENFVPLRPVLYQINLGIGQIELSQVEFKEVNLLTKFLVASNVYILDCHTDVFVWLGRKSSKLARNAALKLADELFYMFKRPDFATITSCLQGTESQLFKTKFRDWDDIIAVDYTRTAESVSKTGADLSKWMSSQKVKIDLASLFAPPPPSLTEEEAQILIEDWNDELIPFERSEFGLSDEVPILVYFLDKGKRFVMLPLEEFGHFFAEDCYVFLCRYYVPPEDIASSDEKLTSVEEGKRLPNGVLQNGTSNGLNGDAQINSLDDFKYVVYFWQGRQASKMGWLTFTFSLQEQFEKSLKKKVDVVQMHQQQENIKFLSHFRQKIVIHRGKRKVGLPNDPVRLYHLRANRNPLTLRCVEIEPDSSKLNSGFVYLLRMVYNNQNGVMPNGGTHLDNFSKIIVWIGSKASPSEARIGEEIAREKFSLGVKSLEVQIVHEGKEPEEFWNALGGKREYETDAEFMKQSRLFRCSNDKGYFSISEKCSDFCQDDLSDDDIMILDSGSHVFLWIGPKSSDVEVKLAYKSAQVYVQNLRLKDPNPRQLMLTMKGKESKKFTKCFHAWGNHKVVQDPRP